jgi:hypothetical protein
MKTIISSAGTALFALLAIAIWSSAATQSGANMVAAQASTAPIAPLELMRSAADLPLQQYDAH